MTVRKAMRDINKEMFMVMFKVHFSSTLTTQLETDIQVFEKKVQNSMIKYGIDLVNFTNLTTRPSATCSKHTETKSHSSKWTLPEKKSTERKYANRKTRIWKRN